jgi:hypothetical protein
MTERHADHTKLLEFEGRIRAMMERAEALLQPDIQKKKSYIEQEDERISFGFRCSHRTILEVRFEVVDYASPSAQGGLDDEQRSLGLSVSDDDDERYGEKGNFLISLREIVSFVPTVTPFLTPDGWIDYSDLDKWEARFCLIDAADRELAQAIKEWCHAKRQGVAAQRERLFRRR